jgi:hypothetical protein
MSDLGVTSYHGAVSPLSALAVRAMQFVVSIHSPGSSNRHCAEHVELHHLSFAEAFKAL